jgi:selenocysteine-specific elongation factor
LLIDETLDENSREMATFNVNVGILGHVDSGKTSLVRALSEELSTASLDKHPQSQARGITLDLGFSSFVIDFPQTLLDQTVQNVYDKLQFTLVDCPGHASLIKTIIGGAQIIDIMLLVIDVTKGIQTQTAESLVIGEITTNLLIVILNKVDLLPEVTKQQEIASCTSKIKKALSNMKFGTNVRFIALSACPGGAGKVGVDIDRKEGKVQDASMKDLVSLMVSILGHLPTRSLKDRNFLFAIDHCFQIKGKGTILTGTVLSGSISVNDSIEIPFLKEERRIKSIQMFKKPVQKISQGDRAGICVVNLDSSLLERGIACTPGTVPTISAGLALVKKVRFFKGDCSTGSRFHVTIGHVTSMATVYFFGAEELSTGWKESTERSLDSYIPSKDQLFQYQPSLLGGRKVKHAPSSISSNEDEKVYLHQYAAIFFDNEVLCPSQSLIIASHLEMPLNVESCRIVFSGHMLAPFPTNSIDEFRSFRIYKPKLKVGKIDRVVSVDNETKSQTVIVKSLFKKDANISTFIGMKVHSRQGQVGIIDSLFGQGGKIKVIFSDLSVEDQNFINLFANMSIGAAKSKKNFILEPEDDVFLSYRKFLHGSFSQ